MANHTGKKRAWDPADVEMLEGMAAENVGQAAMARILKRSISSIEGKLRLLRLAKEQPLLGPGMGRFEVPVPVRSDDIVHIQRIARAHNGYGFPVVTAPLITKLDAMDRHPPRPRLFHEAA